MGLILCYPPAFGGPLANLVFPLALKQEMAYKNMLYEN